MSRALARSDSPPRTPAGGRSGARAAAAALCGLLAAGAPGCQLKYIVTEAGRAMNVACARVPIDGALRKRLPSDEQENLDWVARVREFSERELGLDTGNAYTTYYDTKGKPISSIVVASDPLALIPYRWHFPIAGSVPYKGYFNPARAEAERDRLAKRGYDTARLPVAAFSTLGWFNDPILSTMLKLPKGDLAEVLIHELTHRTVYFAGDSEVNESLATAVSREGTLQLLTHDFGSGSPEIAEYRQGTDGDDLKEVILDRLRSDLDALYRSTLPRSAKLTRKLEIFRTASTALRAAGFTRGLEASNALLVLERQYKGLAPFFVSAMSALGGPKALIAALKRLDGSADAIERLAEEAAAARSKQNSPPEKECTPPGS